MTSQQNNYNVNQIYINDDPNSNMTFITDFVDVENYKKLRQRQTQQIFNLIGPSSNVNVDHREQRKIHLQFASEHLSDDAHSVLLQKRDSTQLHAPYTVKNSETYS